MAGTAGRAELVQLLADRRYEEALDILRLARQKAPEVPELARGIQLLKQRLLRRYLHQLGDLDRVPKLALDPDDPGNEIGDEERELLRLIDGVSSYGDIVLESRFGRFDTYRMLAALAARGVVQVDDEIADHDVTGFTPEPELVDEYEVITEQTPPPVSVPPALLSTPPASVSSDTTLPAVARVVMNENDEETRPLVARPRRSVAWIGASVAAVVLLAGGAWELGLGDAVLGKRAPAAIAAPAPRKEAPQLAELTRPSPPPPAPVPAKVDTPTPSTVEAPTQVAAVALAPVPVPVPAEEEEKAPEPAPAPAVAAAREPAPAPVHPRDVSKRPPTRKLTPDDAAASGPTPSSPSADTVSDALASIEPAFQSCVKKTAGQTAERVTVSLTIDEAGLARDFDTSVGKLPGLIDCVRDASGRVRRGEAPAEMGAVRVSFTIRLAGTDGASSSN